MSFWRIFGILGISIMGFFLALPNVFPNIFPTWWPAKRMILGLDLQGGAHLLLEVDEKSLMEGRYSNLLDSIRQTLRQAHVRYLNLSSHREGVSFTLHNEEDWEKISGDLVFLEGEMQVKKDENRVYLRLPAIVKKTILERAVIKSIETVRQRVDEYGTREPLVQAYGHNRILLQMPGVTDSSHVKGLLGKTAKISFQRVKKIFLKSNNSSPPGDKHSDTVLLSDRDSNFYLVYKDILIPGDTILDARVIFDDQGHGQPQVLFGLNAFGARRLAAATQQYIGQSFAIILDNQVISAPVIRTPIMDGSGVIQGSFTVKEAQDLALLIRSGALPAPLKVIEEKTVGPGLGADSIASGIWATVMAIVAVWLFMLLFYSFFGIFADLALFFNLSLLITALAFLGVTLTLSGIAGIALTMGMAVDANVLINERIREELAHGKQLLWAIDVGYKRAMTTIFDSNITTLIGASLLYYFGSGPVKGFAVTLSLGIVISLFTSIFLSHALVVLWVKMWRPQRLPI